MAALKAILTAFGRRLREGGWLPLLVVTSACLLFREQYPFSNFPMYSTFGSSTWYVYLADGNGQPIPSATAVGMSTPTLKKVFTTELRKERERQHLRGKLTPAGEQAAGEQLLARLRRPSVAQTGGSPQPLRLYEVEITLRSGRLEKATRLVAELR